MQEEERDQGRDRGWMGLSVPQTAATIQQLPRGLEGIRDKGWEMQPQQPR